MRDETLGNPRLRRYTLASVKRRSWTVLPAACALLAATLAVATGCGPRRTASTDVGLAAALIPPGPATPGPDYTLQAGDELNVRFLYTPAHNEQIPVRPDGRITLGVTGQIEAVGLTPPELEKIIAERASRRLRDPEVSVVVTKVSPQRVYVGGEVEKPGEVALQPGMTPLQAVMRAGGFKIGGKPDSVVLISPTADGSFAASRINLQQVMDDGVAERVRLRPNEILYVPKSWIGNANTVVDLYVRGLFPVLPRANAPSVTNSNSY